MAGGWGVVAFMEDLFLEYWIVRNADKVILQEEHILGDPM